jgi:2-polyprenyl-3-methyl-5-hydroxy-6-metoxy-1,4-benzoquinol methylase
MEMTQKPGNEHVASWYDEYTGRQKNVGVNLRHLEIMHQLKKAGLKQNHKVLEIGCGIGTLTSLLAKYVDQGRIKAADISPASIDMGKKLLANYKNIDWVVSDMSDYSSEIKFDFVVLPDVMEHIPQENHAALFRTIAAHCHKQSVVFINIPHPRTLDYNRINHPTKLQVIDQSLRADMLLVDAYAAGFVVGEMVSYALWEMPFDYQRIILYPNTPIQALAKRSKISLKLKELTRKWL